MYEYIARKKNSSHSEAVVTNLNIERNFHDFHSGSRLRGKFLFSDPETLPKLDHAVAKHWQGPCYCKYIDQELTFYFD